ncbi:type VI secretion system Vgr family protein [Marinobacter sp. M1N3S26]|uniref:type VI secretion system Vgr family protein n=1 Tax=Marinobacter sp. M1N3S26 TaxID=3382299 RepID=UPI00387B8289
MSKETQHHFLKIHSSLGEDELILERLTVSEGMSRLFQIEVGFTANQRIRDMKQHIGEEVVISLAMTDKLGSRERYFHGHFLHISELGKPMHNKDGQRYSAVIVPRAWSATSRTNCRIFQDKTALDIVETLLGEHDVDHRKVLNGALYTHRYYVQYNESDWEFICRVLANEGLTFFFEHTDSAHTMVITDSDTAFQPALENQVVFTSRNIGSARISHWEKGYRAMSDHMIERGFDFTRPADPVHVESGEKVPGDLFGQRELFAYHGEDRPLKDKANLTKKHLQALAMEAETLEAISTYRSFGAGLTFSFQSHEDGPQDPNEFLITDILIQAEVPLNADNQPSMGTIAYHNEFLCRPANQPYVPARIPKPVMPGLQTATVTCAAGEEIHVDQHGRVKVQFHWDREGQLDQKSSCWIRVAQSWAGERWGAQFIPRVGQEVLVEFVNGDPDQPLITGSVYNGKNQMPYDPESQKNISGIKSRSTTKGSGANYNEISFDDTLGSEWLRVHAEKDHELTVENNQADDVGVDRTTTIGNDDTETVGNNQTVNVGKNHVLEAGDSITIKTGAASITMYSSGLINIEGSAINVKGSSAINLKAPKINLN